MKAVPVSRPAGLLLRAALVLALVAPGAGSHGSSSPLAVDYEIQLVGGSAVQNPDASWTVETGQRVEWAVMWTVVNRSGGTLNNVRLVDHYSAELDVDPRSVNASRGSVSAAPVGGPRSATEVLWSVGDLPPGGSAALSFRIATGTNPRGLQMYGEPGTYCLDSALTGKWQGGSWSAPCVVVHARELPWMRVEADTTRKDWRIRKPGDYVSLALQFRVASNSGVTVRFEGFGDLTPRGPSRGTPSGAAPIPVSYAAGSTLEEANAAGWWSAEQLDEVAIALPESEALRQGMSWVLWQRLAVSPHHPPLEYEGTGRVVFILANMKDAVVGGGPEGS